MTNRKKITATIALVASMVISGIALAQSAVGADQVRHMATAVRLSGHVCEGMTGLYLGTTSDGEKIYIVECRGGDRFVYMALPGGKVGVTPCAAMRAQGFDC